MFAPKKDGKLRFCIDYHRLNTLTVKDSYPLPRMDECIDSLGEAKVFSTLDAYWGYWQVPINPEDRPKTSFVCHAGQFQCVRMPFGLTNAPATFQRALDIVLTRFKWKSCLVYIDDIIIFSKTVDEHIRHVDEILTTLAEANITLKISKCRFFSETVEYLGHLIKPGKLEIDSANTKSLRDAQPPTNKSQIRSFLGLCNVYRRFIKNFAVLAFPLNQLLRKNTPDSFELNEEQMKSFHKFIDIICSPPVLALPTRNLPYILDTDASAYGLGATLFQVHDDGKKPIGFWSRSLKDAEKSYSATERECLAVVWALQTLRPYLLYEEFTVFTDHDSLTWLYNVTEPSGKLTRWRLRLAEFHFAIKYRKGADNHHADALSRLLTGSPTVNDDENDVIPTFTLTDDTASDTDSHMSTSTVTDESSDDDADHSEFLEPEYSEIDHVLATQPAPQPLNFNQITLEELVVAQHNDAFCAEISRRLNEGVKMPFAEDDNGLLVRTANSDHQIVIPHSLKQRVLTLNHYPLLAGHPGGRKLYQRIKRHFYWPALAVDCYALVRNCTECAKNRIKLRKNVGPLKLFPAKAPLESVSIDILGELVRTQRGNRYILVVTDRFTKLVKAIPLKGVSAAEVAKAFVEHWVFNFGPPSELISDNGRQFTSRFFMDVCRILTIHNAFTTTYHPQTNAQAERFNRTILAAIRSYTNDHPRDWDLYTPALTYAYNCSPQTSTSLAPFELVLSKPPGPLAADIPTEEHNDTVSYRQKWKSWLTKAIKDTTDQLQKAQERYKRSFDKRLRKQREEIRKDDYVFLRVERRNDKEHRHKLAAIADGPYRVKDVNTEAKTVVIEYPDRTVENVSRSRVVLAPEPQTMKQLHDKTRPMTIHDTITGLPAPESANLRHIVQQPTPEGEHEEPTQQREQETSTAQADNTNGEHAEETHADNSETINEQSKDDQETTTLRRSSRLNPQKNNEQEHDDSDNQTEEQENERRTAENDDEEADNNEDEKEDEPDEFEMEKILAHRRNRSAKHEHAAIGETLYRIRWTGYAPNPDTWEPISHIPRSHVLRYHKQKKLAIPTNIDRAIDG